MKIETYLNAMELAALVKHEFVNRLMSVNIDSVVYRTYAKAHEKRYRQRNAFRARILSMDAEKDARIKQLHKAYFDAMNMPPPNPPRK